MAALTTQKRHSALRRERRPSAGGPVQLVRRIGAAGRRVAGRGCRSRLVDQGVDPTGPVARPVRYTLCRFRMGDVTLEGEVVLYVGGWDRRQRTRLGAAWRHAGADALGGAGDDRDSGWLMRRVHLTRYVS